MVTVVVAGVGGQGVITLSRIIGLAALKRGFNVRIGETLGMSQRLGRVVSYVRFGDNVRSPLPLRGDVKFLIGMEALEALRVAEATCGKEAVAIVNRRTIPTLTTLLGIERYPPMDAIGKRIEGICGRLIWVDAYGISLFRLGDLRQENMVMLGVFARLAEGILRPSDVERAIRDRFEEDRAEEAIRAYRLGLEALSAL